MSEGCPEQPSTPQAIEGTDGHWLGEQMLKHNLVNKTTPWQGLKWTGLKLPSGARATKEMVNYVGRYVDYVWRHHQANKGELHVETRLYMPKIDERMFGSADVIQITQYKTLHVFDLKYGFYLVDPEGNTQMMCYLLGALTKFKHLIDLTKPVTAHICQPRPKHKDGEFRVAKFSIEELIIFGNQVKAAIKESDGPNPRMVSGDHCTFCPAEFICPELNKVGRHIFT